MQGAHLLTHTLKNAGVTTIFSLSGNQIMPVYDACIDTGIRIVHTRHEAAAVYMADAWAQITGEIGIALVAGGPGFANSMSPLFSARHANSPVLLLSGDSSLSQDGLGAFQELNQAAITAPLVKQSRRSQNVDDIGQDVMQLIGIARSGRPGPVHLALPFDLLEASTQACTPLPSSIPVQQISAPHLATLISHLSNAQRPIILTGPHCNDSRAGTTLKRLRQAACIPVIPMESPRGLKDPMLGTFSDVLSDADLIVLIGKELDFTLHFGNTPAFPANATVIMVDPDANVIDNAKKQLGKRLVHQAQADSLTTLDTLASAFTSSKHMTWTKQVNQAIANRQLVSARQPEEGKLLPQDICTHVQTLIDKADEAILICDGGEFGQWAQAFCHAPTRIINGVSGAIGGGLSYAIAAKIARPDATVIALMGDGTTGFHLAEFDTAVRENAPFIAIVGNDDKWNAEHLIQIRSYGEDRTMGCLLNPDARYDGVAQALGGVGFDVSFADEFSQALVNASQSQKPACINAHIHGLPAPVYHLEH